MTKVEDLKKFKEFQERKLKDKVMDTLLDDLVGFIFEENETRANINKYSYTREGLDDKLRDKKLKALEKKSEKLRDREGKYKELLQTMNSLFLDSYYDFYNYITVQNLDRFNIMMAWIQRHKEQN